MEVIRDKFTADSCRDHSQCDKSQQVGKTVVADVCAYGMVCIIALPYLWKMLPADGLMLLVSGGLAYTIGIFFYADKKHKFMHSVWHLFVMTGSVLHYFFVLYFIL